MLSWLRFQKAARQLHFPARHIRRLDGDLIVMERQFDRHDTRTEINTTMLTDGQRVLAYGDGGSGNLAVVGSGYSEAWRRVIAREATYVFIVQGAYFPDSTTSAWRGDGGETPESRGVSRIYLAGNADLDQVAQEVRRLGGYGSIDPRRYRRRDLATRLLEATP